MSFEGFTNFVNNEPTGVAEHLLIAGRDQMIARWRNATVRMTPFYGAAAIGLIENGGFTQPGDAPLLVGMAATGLPAGDPTTNNIVYRNQNIAQTVGAAHNQDTTTQPTVSEQAQAEQEQAERAVAASNQSYHPDSPEYQQLYQDALPDDGAFTLWGGTKGISRWAFAALDLPFVNSFDATSRMQSLNETLELDRGTNLNPNESWDLFSGASDKTLSLAIPGLSYARTATEGGRVNMGTGAFARGDVAQEIQDSLTTHDEWVAGLTQQDYDKARSQAGPGERVSVTGVMGQQIYVDSYEQWVDVNKNAGRAAIVDSMALDSPGQEALGQAFGTYADDIFQDGVYGVANDGTYYQSTFGRFVAAEVLQMSPEWFASKAISGVIDFGKHLLDIPIGKAAKGAAKGVSAVGKALGNTPDGMKVLGVGGNKLIGLSEEGGQFARSTTTLTDAAKWVDPDARKGFVSDIQTGKLDVGKTKNAIARGSDVALNDALRTVEELRKVGLRGRTKSGTKLTEGQVDNLVYQAEQGGYAGRRWAEKTLAQIHNDPDAVAAQLDNLDAVIARSDDMSIIQRRLGDSTAHVEDVKLEQIGKDVDHLEDMLVNGKASVVLDEAGNPAVTFDADLGQAQRTIHSLNEAMQTRMVERADAAQNWLRLDGEARTLRQTMSGFPGDRRTKAYRDMKKRLAQISDEMDTVQRGDTGKTISWGGRHSVEAVARGASESKLASAPGALNANLFNQKWHTRRWAEGALGGDGAKDEVDNLIRVLRRHDAPGHLSKHANAYEKPMSADTVRRLINGSDGRVDDFLKRGAEASNHTEMWNLLRRSTDHTTHASINPALIDALVRADSPELFGEALVRMAKGEIFVANRVKLLGDWAEQGGAIVNASNFVGAGAGFIHGGLVGGENEGKKWDMGDALGGLIMGGVAGRYAGSVGVGSAALAANKFGKGMAATRKIDDLADMMDVMLAGSRSATANRLQSLQNRSRKIGVTQQRYDELSRPQQFTAAFGHLPFGRKLAKEAPTKLSLNSPAGMYKGLRDYARAFGMRGDERIVRLTRKVDTGIDPATGRTLRETETVKLNSTNFESVDEFEAAIDAAKADNFDIIDDVDLDDVFAEIAQMQPNNTAAGWKALKGFFKVVDAQLLDADVPDHMRRAATRFAEEGTEDYLSNVDAVGTPANLQQMLVNGDKLSTADAPLLTSELWGGNISLPSPEIINRVMNHTHTLGRVSNTLTGRGVTGASLNKLRGKLPDTDWGEVLTPEFERNVASRFMRNATSLAFVPLVLLTRPISFASKVLGDDQARLAAGGLGAWAPASPMAWMVGNWKAFKRAFAPNDSSLRMAPSTSSVTGDIFDPARGALKADGLDQISKADMDDGVQAHMRIADKSRTRESKQVSYGTTGWKTVPRTSDEYVDGLTREYRQLLRDPFVRRLSAKNTDDPVSDTFEWLTGTPEGQRELRLWAEGNADTLEEAEALMEPEALQGFLWDQYARMHLKSGGDWVFIDPNGNLTKADRTGFSEAETAQWRQDLAENGPGYRITRKGDEDLLETIRTGRLGDNMVWDEATGKWKKEYGTSVRNKGGSITDEVNEAITDLMRQKNETFDKAFNRADKASQESGALHRFPNTVKTASKPEPVKLRGEYARSLEWLYDTVLGPMSQRISREPAFASHYWERVGMLLPQMTDDVAEAYLEVARHESPQLEATVRRVAAQFEEMGMTAKTIDDFQFVDMNAKAYGVEKLNNTLFDLYQQRNFIDSVRVLAPFAGPMVEAFENWARVLRRRPATVWRRGLQAYNMFYDPSPIAQDRKDDNGFRTGFGTFYTDQETGQDMFRYPFTGPVNRWMFDRPDSGTDDRFESQIRKFNVVFGTTDFSDPETVRAPGAGVPLEALNPGLGMFAAMPIGYALRNKEGIAKQAYDVLFEYGEGDSFLTEITPFHLQRMMEKYPAFDFIIGEEGVQRRESAMRDQLGLMTVNGELGRHPGATWNVDNEWEIDEAKAEAMDRATRQSFFEGLVRGMLPGLDAPKPQVQIEGMMEDGFPGAEKLLPYAELAEEAYSLSTEEGAVLIPLPDGTEISTEGDWEVITDHLNQKYGLNIFSADFVSFPDTKTVFTGIYTEDAANWRAANPTKTSGNLEHSGFLLTPNLVTEIEKEDKEFYWPARDAAQERDDIEWQNIENDLDETIESRLLAMEVRHLDSYADEMFGLDEDLEGTAQFAKDEFKSQQRQEILSRFQRENFPVGNVETVRNEILGWKNIDWANEVEPLTVEEEATIRLVHWYIDMRDYADSLAAQAEIKEVSHKGRSFEEKEIMSQLRIELDQAVATQLASDAKLGISTGNFPTIYSQYLRPEYEEYLPPDPLEEMANSLYGSEESYIEPYVIGGNR